MEVVSRSAWVLRVATFVWGVLLAITAARSSRDPAHDPDRAVISYALEGPTLDTSRRGSTRWDVDLSGWPEGKGDGELYLWFGDWEFYSDAPPSTSIRYTVRAFTPDAPEASRFLSGPRLDSDPHGGPVGTVAVVGQDRRLAIEVEIIEPDPALARAQLRLTGVDDGLRLEGLLIGEELERLGARLLFVVGTPIVVTAWTLVWLRRRARRGTATTPWMRIVLLIASVAWLATTGRSCAFVVANIRS